jgi:hypothetical protein
MRAFRESTQAELDALRAFVLTLDVPDARPGIDFDPRSSHAVSSCSMSTGA